MTEKPKSTPPPQRHPATGIRGGYQPGEIKGGGYVPEKNQAPPPPPPLPPPPKGGSGKTG